jgi:sugar/nucleoside kinase (ribokinase family)
MQDDRPGVDYLIYGKIIIDNIQLSTGRLEEGIIGGGGPQGLFGAALWDPSVGFLSRTGTDIEPHFEKDLEDLGADLQGWARYPDLLTMRGNQMRYDENEYMLDPRGELSSLMIRKENWRKLLARPLDLPPGYRKPRVIHLITEYADEPMVRAALELREAGAIFSLEPLIDYRNWSNRAAILGLLRQVDIATPDWPSASGIAGSEEPREVLEFWSKLGPEMVAIRHGHRGSYTWDRTHDIFWHIPAVPVPVVDPTGAGNSYGGGLSVGWDVTRDARLAGCYGAVSASFLVRRVGLPIMTTELRAEAAKMREQALLMVEQLR